jgi:hypothetical protein
MVCQMIARMLRSAALCSTWNGRRSALLSSHTSRLEIGLEPWGAHSVCSQCESNGRLSEHLGRCSSFAPEPRSTLGPISPPRGLGGCLRSISLSVRCRARDRERSRVAGTHPNPCPANLRKRESTARLPTPRKSGTLSRRAQDWPHQTFGGEGNATSASRKALNSTDYLPRDGGLEATPSWCR